MGEKSGTNCWSYRFAMIVPLGILYLVMKSGDKPSKNPDEESGKTKMTQALIGTIVVTHMIFSYLCKNGYTMIAWLILLGPIAAPAMLGATFIATLAGAGIAVSNMKQNEQKNINSS